MAQSNFNASLRRVLAHEGRFTDHPADPGGPTNFGITIGDYRKYVKSDATAAEVRAMRIEDAEEIYRTKYWQVLRCDDLPSGIDYAVFDYGVNSGVSRAGKVLGRLLGIPADSATINETIIAAASRSDAKYLITAICDERLAFLKGLKTWPVFGVGWGRRVSEVRSAALAMVTAATADGRKAPSGVAPKVAAAGVVVAAGAVAAHHVADFTLTNLIAGMVILAVVVSAAGLAWHLRKREEI
jgi:lysozyme family protein